MDGKKKMTTNGRTRPFEPTVTSSVADFTHDAIELAELQLQLLMHDVKASSARARTSLVLALLGLCVLLSSAPIALMALAEYFIDQLNWSSAASYAAAAAVGFLLSFADFVATYLQMKRGLVTLERSREELQRNVRWLKSQLRSSTANRMTPTT
jgi:hypothetical protein